MHRVVSIDFSAATGAPRLRIEVDGRSRDVPLDTCGIDPLSEAIAPRFHRVALCAVGLDLFRWWTSFHEALGREFVDRVGEADRAAVCLDYAMLLATIGQRGISLNDYLRSGRHGIDLGFASAGLKGRQLGEFLSGDGSSYVPTAVIPTLDAADFRHRVGPDTTRCQLDLCGDQQFDLSRLSALATALDDREIRCGWLLHGHGRYPSVDALRTLCSGIQAVKNATGKSPVVRAVIEPLADTIAISNATLGGFVEWPERPVILAGSSARSWDGVRRTMDIGYRGLYVTADRGPVDLILRACLIRSRQQLEPVARWTVEFADNTFPPGEFQSLQHQLIALLA